MALDFSAQPPAWLTRRSEWARDTGERGIESLMKGVQFFTDQKKQNLNMASAALGIEAQQQALDLNAVQLRNVGEDMATIPKWLRDHSDFESRQNAEVPVPKSEWGFKVLEQTRLRDAQSLQQRVATKDISDFAKQIERVSEVDRAAIQAIPRNRDGTPSAEQWRMLGVAEKTRLDKAEAQAKIDQASGVTTTVTDKEGGVSKTYKPPVIATKGEEITLSDGSKMVRTGPNTFKFMTKGGSKELTKAQLLGVAKHLQLIDADDPNAKIINEFLANEAVEQIGGTQKPQFFKNLKEKANTVTTNSGLRYQVVPVK